MLDHQGRELARAEGRAAVADAAAPEVAAGAVAELCAAAARTAGSALPADVVWAGLSGAGREAARSAVELELGRAGIAVHVRVGTDVLAAFHDVFPEGPGILLIAGTGSIAWARAEDGREGRVGGWGHHIGDEGSGFAIGVDALRRVARHADGRAPETTLQARVLEHLGLTRVDELVTWASRASRAQVADLAPLVAESARAGDAVAGEILVEAIDELMSHVVTILENMGPWSRPPPVALAGGLIQRGGPLRGPLEAALATRHIRPMDEEPDPALGAAKLALQLAERGAD